MKTLLVYPPNIATERNAGYVSAGTPLGIAMLGASLEREGLEAELLDALNEGFITDPDAHPVGEVQRVSKGMCLKNPLDEPFPEGTFTLGLSFEQIAARVRASGAGIVGISVIFSSVYPVARHIARLVKEVDPSIKVVMGGNHPTAEPSKVLMEGNVDYVVMGEGEKSFPELVRCLSDGRAGDAAAIPGVGSLNEKGMPILNAPNLIEDLDSLPFPAFHKLPMEKYFAASAEGRTVKMMTSRGCTFNCCFCSVPVNSQRRFRARSPEDVLAEIDELVRDFSIEGIMFEDDNMTLNTERAREIFRLIAERDYKLKLYARNFRADTFDLDMLRLMKRAGFETIWVTPESGNQRVLNEVIDKKFDLQSVDRAVGLIKEAGLKSAAAFVIGIPGETRDEIQDTVDYARKLKDLGVDDFWVSIATPITGTRLYKDAVRNGLIDKMETDNFSYLDARLTTSEFTAEEMLELRSNLMDELNHRETRAA